MSKKAVVFASVFFKSKIKVGSQHYAEALIKEGYEVLYISFPVSIFHYLFFFRRENKKRLFNRFDKSEDVFSFIPFSGIPLFNIFPFNRIFFLKKWVFLSDLIFNKRIREFLLNVDLVWLESAYFVNLAEYVRSKSENVVIFTRMADNVLAFDNFPNDYGLLLNESFELSNKIIVSAKTLLAKIDPRFHTKVIHLPNGINVNNLRSYSREMPKEYLTAKTRTKIIYIGAIDKWFDWEVIRHILISIDDISVFIIGPVIQKPDFSYDNLYILGARGHVEIGKYLYNADIGIIPFKRNDLINYVDPIKFYEYSYFNLPTVCSYWDEVATFEEKIFLAKDKRDFVDQIKLLINNAHSKNFLNLDFSKRDWHYNLKQLL